MNVYLTKWNLKNTTDKPMYKIGISKYGKNKLVSERFGDKWNTKHLYDMFNIEVLKSVQFSSESYSLARAAALGMEHAFHSMCPKNFFLEKYLDLEEGILDGMGGINEFFLMPDYLTEDKLCVIFQTAMDNAWKLENNLKSYRNTVTSNMEMAI